MSVAYIALAVCSIAPIALCKIEEGENGRCSTAQLSSLVCELLLQHCCECISELNLLKTCKSTSCDFNMASRLLQKKRTFPKFQENECFTKRAKTCTLKAESKKSSQRLTDDFFNKNCTELAKALLGQILVRKSKEGRIACKIVEVESYMAKDDKASHSYNHKQTERNKAMFMKPGTVYVYMTYGMYYCMNISSQGLGDAVLLRAVEPAEGVEVMKKRRKENQKSAKNLLEKNICNGPSKLCQALGICKKMNQVDLVKSDKIWLEKGETISESAIVQCKRIGLSKKSGIWADKPLRFYILGNCYVSVKNKAVEAEYRNK